MLSSSSSNMEELHAPAGTTSELVGTARQLLAARRKNTGTSVGAGAGSVKGEASSPSVMTTITADQSQSIGSSSASSSPLVTPISTSPTPSIEHNSQSFATAERKILVEPWYEKPGSAPFDDIKKPMGFTWLAVPKECPGIVYRVVNGTTIEALDLSEEGLMVLASLQLDSPALYLCCSEDAAMVACACADGSLQLFNVEPFRGFLSAWKVRSAHSHVMNDTVESSDFNQGFNAPSSVRSMSFSGQFLLIVDALRFKASVYHVENPRNLVGGALDRIEIQCADWGPQLTERDKGLFVGDTSGVVHMLSLNDHNGILSPKWQHSYRDEDGLAYACTHLHWQNACQTIAAGFYRLSENPLEADAWHHTVLCVGTVHLEKGITSDWEKVGCLPAMSEAPVSCRPTLHTSEMVLHETNPAVLFASNLSAGAQLMIRGDEDVWETMTLEYNHEEMTNTVVYSMGKALAQATTGDGVPPISCLLSVSNAGTLACFKIPVELLRTYLNSSNGLEIISRLGLVGRHSHTSVAKAHSCMEAYQVTRVRRYKTLNSQKIHHSAMVSNFSWLAVPSACVGLAYRVIEGNAIQAVMISESDVCHVTSALSEGWIVCIACSADGKTVAVAHEDGSIVLYRMKGNALEKTRSIPPGATDAHNIRDMSFSDDLLLIVDSEVQKVCVYQANGADAVHQVDNISISCASWGCQDSVTMGTPLAIGDDMGNIRIYGVQAGCSMEARSIFPFPGEGVADGFVCTHLQFFNQGQQLFACFSRPKGPLEASNDAQVYETITFVADVSVATCALYNWKEIGEVVGVQVDRQQRPTFASSILLREDKNAMIVLGMPGSNVFYFYTEHESTVWSWQAARIPENHNSGSKVFSFGISWAYFGGDTCSSPSTILLVTADGALNIVNVELSSETSTPSLDRVENYFEWRQLQCNSLEFVDDSHAMSFQGEEAVSTPKHLRSLSDGILREDPLHSAPGAAESGFLRHSLKPRVLNSVVEESIATTMQGGEKEVMGRNPSSFTGLRTEHEQLNRDNLRLRLEVERTNRMADEKVSAERHRRSETESQLHRLMENLKRREAEVLTLKSALSDAEEARQKSEENLAILRIDLETKTVEMNGASCIASMRAAEKDELQEKINSMRKIQRGLEEQVAALEEADVAKSAEIELLSALSTAERDNFQDRMKLLENNNSILEQSFTELQGNTTDLEAMIGQHQEKGEVEGVDSNLMFPGLLASAPHAENQKALPLKDQVKRLLEEKVELVEKCQEALSITRESVLESETNGNDHTLLNNNEESVKTNTLGQALLCAVGSLSTRLSTCLTEQKKLTVRYNALQNESKGKVERLDARILVYEKEGKNLACSLQEVQKKLQEKSSLHESNQKRLEAELARVLQENEKATIMVHQLEGEKLQLLGQLSAHVKEAEEYRKTMELKQSLSEEDLQRIQLRLQASESEMASLREINTDVHAELTRLELDKNSLLSERQCLSALADERLSETNKLQSTLKLLEKETGEQMLCLESNLQASKAEMEALQERNLELDALLRETSVAKVNLNLRVNELEAELRQEVEKHKSSLSVANAALRSLNDENAELQAAKVDYQQVNTSLSNEVTRLSGIIDARQKEKEKLVCQLKEVEGSTKRESERFTSTQRTNEVKLASLRKFLSDSEATVSLVKAEKQKLKAQIDHLFDLAEKRLAQKDEAEAQVQHMDIKLKSDCTRFQADLRTCKTELQVLNQKMADTQALRSQLEVEKSKLEKENEHLAALASTRLLEAEKAEAQIQALEARAQGDRESHMSSLRDCEAELEALKCKEAELKAYQRAAEGEKALLLSENASLSALAQEMLAEKETLEAKILALEAKIECDEKEYAKNLKDRQSELRALEQSMSGSHDETSKLLVQIERLHSASEVMAQEKESLETCIKSLETKMQGDLESYESEIGQCKEALEGLQQNETSMAAMRSQLEVEKSKLVKENEHLAALASTRLLEAEKAEAQIQALEARAQGDRESHMSSLRDCEAELEALKCKEAELKAYQRAAEGEKALLLSENASLSALAQEMLAEKETLEAKILALEAKIECDEKEYAKNLKDRQSELRALEQSMSGSHDETSKLLVQIERLHSASEVMAQEKESLETCIKSLETKMQGDLESYESEIGQCKEALEGLQQNETSMAAMRSQLEVEKSKLIKENEHLAALASTRLLEAEKAEAQIQALEARWQGDRESHMSSLRDCETELEALKCKEAELKAYQRAVEGEKALLLSENASLSTLAQEMLAEKETLEAKILALEAKIECDEKEYAKNLKDRQTEMHSVNESETQALLAEYEGQTLRERAQNQRLSSLLELALTEKERLLAHTQTLEQKTRQALEEAESISKAREEEQKLRAEKRIHDVQMQEELEKQNLLAKIEQLSSLNAISRNEAEVHLIELQARLKDAVMECQTCKAELALSKANTAKMKKRFDALEGERSTLLNEMDKLTLLAGRNESEHQKALANLQRQHFQTKGMFDSRLKTQQDELESLRLSDTKLSLEKTESDMFSLVCGVKQICSSLRADLLCLLSLSDQLSSSRLSCFFRLFVQGREMKHNDKNTFKLSLERIVIAVDDLIQLASDGRCDCCGKAFCSKFETFCGTSPNFGGRSWGAAEEALVSESPSPRASKGLRLGSKIHQTRFVKARLNFDLELSDEKSLVFAGLQLGKCWSSNRLFLLLLFTLSFTVLVTKSSGSWLGTTPVSRLRPTSDEHQQGTGIGMQPTCPECDGSSTEESDL